MNIAIQRAQIDAANQNARFQIEQARHTAEIQVSSARESARTQTERADRLQQVEQILSIFNSNSVPLQSFRELMNNIRIALLLDSESLRAIAQIESEYGVCYNELPDWCQEKIAQITNVYRSFFSRDTVDGDALMAVIFSNGLSARIERDMRLFVSTQQSEVNSAPEPRIPNGDRTRFITFLVFFDWNEIDITRRAEEIIGEVAVRFQAGEFRISVEGHADTSEGFSHVSARRAVELSYARAQQVAESIRRLGVPSDRIEVRHFGRDRLLVPTAFNQREPQNRRVEVILERVN